MSNGFAQTVSKNALAYFLTNTDDSDVSAQEPPEIRRARLLAEETLLETLVVQRRADLNGYPSEPGALEAQRSRLDVSIDKAAVATATNQAEITTLERERDVLSAEHSRTRSRLIFVAEQLQRLRLLDSYYVTDKERLEAVVEASRVYHDLPEGVCSLCRAPLTGAAADATHEALEIASQGEILKVTFLREELSKSIADFEREEVAIREALNVLAQKLAGLDLELQGVLMPVARASHTELARLIQENTELAHMEVMARSLGELEARLSAVRLELNRQVTKPKFMSRLTAGSTAEFCNVISQILVAWKYPFPQTVTFDPKKFDFVVGGRARASRGKGHRAIIFAAVAIGLMKYCRIKGFPHPGFVVIDTPLNPFKGPVDNTPEAVLTDDVKLAFLEYVANDLSGDQVIIIENELPTGELLKSLEQTHVFTGNSGGGRFGFFPTR